MAAHAAPPGVGNLTSYEARRVDSLARMLCAVLLPSLAPIPIHHACMHACSFSDLSVTICQQRLSLGLV
jgi:hypothetical protein